MIKNIFLGSHVNMSSPDYYLATVKAALAMGENCFMFYTGAPQNTVRKPTSQLKIKEGRKILEENNIDESKIIIHAPYIINLANSVNQYTRNLAISFLKQEIQRVNDFNVKTLVLHPGSHVGAGNKAGLDALIEGLNIVLKDDKTPVKIALETMSGKGNEIGSSFDELKYVIDGVIRKDKIGICLDTCHINDAGYAVKDVDSILDEFNKIIGLDKLLVIHINDSLNTRGAHKDRHANIGYGSIGFETIYKYVFHPKLTNIPKILETPWVNNQPPYKKEIEMLRNNSYEENWIEKLLPISLI